MLAEPDFSHGSKKTWLVLSSVSKYIILHKSDFYQGLGTLHYKIITVYLIIINVNFAEI